MTEAGDSGIRNNSTAISGKRKPNRALRFVLVTLVGLAVLCLLTFFVGGPSYVFPELFLYPFLDTANMDCSRFHVPFPIGANEKLVDKSILTGSVCGPPCWEGLTPGASTQDDVLQILESLPRVDQSSIEIGDLYGDHRNIYWESSLTSKRSFGGSANIDVKSKRVVSISYFPEFELSIQQLIEKYGAPDYINVLGVTIDTPALCYEVNMVWLKHGLVATSDMIPRSSKVSPSLRVVTAQYSMPADDLQTFADRANWYDSYIEYWHPWDSLDSIDVK